MSNTHRGLYVRIGDAEFKRLSKEQVDKMKRAPEVKVLVQRTLRAAATLRALISWMEVVDRRGYRMTGGDIHLIKLPNRERLTQVVKDLEDARRGL